MKASLRGFTLVEMVITITLAGIIAVGVIQVSGKMVGSSANPMLRYQSIAIAEAYLNEILAKKFLVMGHADCAAPATRAAYEYICQYNGLTNTGAVDQAGATISALSAYSVTVTVFESALLDDIPQTATQLITINVDGPADLDASLSAYRSDF
jgi:MSHA pilin protein MshD